MICNGGGAHTSSSLGCVNRLEAGCMLGKLFCALEKEMATHFSVLAWRIPGTGEPGGLPTLGSSLRSPAEGEGHEGKS